MINNFKIRINWLYTSIVFFCSWLICLVCLFLLSGNLKQIDNLEIENQKLEKTNSSQTKLIDNYKNTIAELDQITNNTKVEVDSLKNEILLKETDTKFIHIYDEKIKYINRFTISDMQSSYDSLFSAKE